MAQLTHSQSRFLFWTHKAIFVTVAGPTMIMPASAAESATCLLASVGVGYAAARARYQTTSWKNLVKLCAAGALAHGAFVASAAHLLIDANYGLITSRPDDTTKASPASLAR
jgi:hypothetical protein